MPLPTAPSCVLRARPRAGSAGHTALDKATHATHLLEGGAELTMVRDNLRHASPATTSMVPHTDDARRGKQVADRFAAPRA